MFDPQESSVKHIFLWKKFVFAALVTICFFVFIEVVLGVVGVKPYTSLNDPFVGFSYFQPLFVEETQSDGSVMMTTAKNKLKFFNAQNFPKKKGPNTFRIFCLGGSTTYGRPYDDKMSFSSWLRAFLPVADPSHQWEVINAGGISYASYRVAELMKELGQYEPDLFIIYSGHNEFLENRTYQHVQEIPWVIVGLTEILGSTRIYSAMKYVIDKAVPSSSSQAQKKYQMTGEVQEILNQSVGPEAYQRDDLFEQDVIAHFKFNLERMVAAARSVGSEIIFVNPVKNLKDISPFKSQIDEGLTGDKRKRWENLYISGTSLFNSGKYGEAVNIFQKALVIDSRFAHVDFSLGWAFFKLGQFGEAKESFQRAVDEDICPLRILTPMIRDLRSVTEKMGVPLVDFQSSLEKIYARDYGHTIFGEEYFLDHVHMTYQGYRLLALNLLDELVRQGTVKPVPTWNDEAIAAVTKKKEAQLDPEMIARSLFNLGSVMNWAGKLEEAHNLYLKSYEIFKNKETLIILGQNALRRENPTQAIEYFNKIVETYPGNHSAQEIAGLFENRGRSEEDMQRYREVHRLAEAHYGLGKALKKLGKNDDALNNFKEAVRIVPDSLEMRQSLAESYTATEHIGEAVREYENVLKMNPNLFSEHVNLGVLLVISGEKEKAEPHFRKAIQLNPASAIPEYNLASVLQMRGEIQQAIDHYQKTIAKDPEYGEAYYNLGMIMQEQGRSKEAEAFFSKAKRIAPKSNQN
ncbi:MAG: tetratricopeptide repeat protein [Proteobacteria bacterium]|nr:tetratricopeptide repeat protein [Pseudomonadota bacterium]MBU1714042.1 tetratricopeptide repeat protein [Pseudomonadota bacterium]